MTDGLALHGIGCPLPAGWEAVGSAGGWRRGQVLVAASDGPPLLAIGWERAAATAEPPRLLAALERRMRSELGCGERRACSAISGGLLARWAAPPGELCGGVRCVRPASAADAGPGVALVVRALAPAGVAAAHAALAGAWARAADQPTPLRIYGLDLELPPWWRLEGMQQLAGLVRALFLHHPQGRLDRIAGALVLRRFACAGRVLAGRTPAEWIAEQLGRRETVLSSAVVDGVTAVGTRRPAPGWWRRLAGASEGRSFHAWLEAGGDRLVLQEWYGTGTPVMCLRSAVPTGS